MWRRGDADQNPGMQSGQINLLAWILAELTPKSLVATLKRRHLRTVDNRTVGRRVKSSKPHLDGARVRIHESITADNPRA